MCFLSIIHSPHLSLFSVFLQGLKVLAADAFEDKLNFRIASWMAADLLFYGYATDEILHNWLLFVCMVNALCNQGGVALSVSF